MLVIVSFTTPKKRYATDCYLFITVVISNVRIRRHTFHGEEEVRLADVLRLPKDYFVHPDRAHVHLVELVKHFGCNLDNIFPKSRCFTGIIPTFYFTCLNPMLFFFFLSSNYFLSERIFAFVFFFSNNSLDVSFARDFFVRICFVN